MKKHFVVILGLLGASSCMAFGQSSKTPAKAKTTPAAKPTAKAPKPAAEQAKPAASAGKPAVAPAPAGKSPQPAKEAPIAPAPASKPPAEVPAAVVEPPKAVIENPYTEKPFDDSMTMVPVGYRGQNLQLLYQALKEAFGPKTEFETTAAHEARMKTAMDKELVGSLTAKSTFALAVDLMPEEELDEELKEYAPVQYFADPQILMVTHGLTEGPLDEDFDAERGGAASSDLGGTVIKGVYTGENAYGAKREITKKEIKDWMLLLMNHEKFRFKSKMKAADKTEFVRTMDEDDFLPMIKFEVPMTPEKAQAVKPNLRLLVIYSLVKPYVKYDRDYITPKIDNPVDATIDDYFVCAVAQQLWLYDGKTGEILHRVLPQK